MRNYHILYDLQLSSVDKEGNFVLEKDSNVNFATKLIKYIKEYFPDKYTFSMIVPYRNNDLELFKYAESIIVPEYYTNKVFSSRYNWNVDDINEKLKDTLHKCDIIWTNNPTLVNNWKTLLNELKLDKVKIISYNHWIDSDLYPKISHKIPYFIRQCEGSLLADLQLCNSKEGVKQITNVTKKFFKLNELKKIGIELCIDFLPPIIDILEIISYYQDKNVEKEIKILYNHRLSSLGYYNDALNRFLHVLSRLYQNSSIKNISVVFTDPSNKINVNNIDIFLKNCIDAAPYHYSVKNLDRKEYLKELWDSDICVSTFYDNGGCWSMSLAEAMIANNAIVIFDCNAYKEMVPKDFKYKVKNEEEFFIKLMEIIVNVDKRNYNNLVSKKYYVNNYYPKIIIDKFDYLVERIFEGDQDV